MHIMGRSTDGNVERAFSLRLHRNTSIAGILFNCKEKPKVSASVPACAIHLHSMVVYELFSQHKVITEVSLGFVFLH